MVCRYCGAQADEGDLFCAGCGAPPGGKAAAEKPVSPLFSPAGASPCGGQPPRPARGKKVPEPPIAFFLQLGALVLLAAVAAVLLRRPGGTVTDVTRLEPDCPFYLISSEENYEKMAVYSEPPWWPGGRLLQLRPVHGPQGLLYVDTDGTLWRHRRRSDGNHPAWSAPSLSDGGDAAAFQTAEGAFIFWRTPAARPFCSPTTSRWRTSPSPRTAAPRPSPRGILLCTGPG